jgi:hypothetical protein
MTPQLRKVIDKLVSLDDEERRVEAKRHPNGLVLDLITEEMIEDILQGERSPVVAVVETLSGDDVVYLTALAWFGRGDGVAEPGATFRAVLKHATGRSGEGSVGYLCGMPLHRYLPLGLKRLGIE